MTQNPIHDFERFLRYLDGTGSPEERRTVEERLASDPDAATLADEIRRILAHLGRARPSLLEGDRLTSLVDAFERSRAAAGGASERFVCTEDSWDEAELMGVRSGRFGDRYLRFEHPRLGLTISWRPGAELTPGVLTGKIAFRNRHDRADGLRVQVQAGAESPRSDRTVDGGRFVLRDVPQCWPMIVSIEDPVGKGMLRAIEIPESDGPRGA